MNESPDPQEPGRHGEEPEPLPPHAAEGAVPPPGVPAVPHVPPPAQGAVPPAPSPAPSRRFSIGAGVGAGLGAFLLCGMIGTSIILSSLGSTSGIGPLIAFAAVFLVVPVAAIVMLFFRRTRPGAAGVLIVFAAGWILLVGPCIVPAFVSYQA